MPGNDKTAKSEEAEKQKKKANIEATSQTRDETQYPRDKASPSRIKTIKTAPKHEAQSTQ
jgi:hypothetical protein